MSFENVSTLISELRQGKMILLVDDEHRENEGDLIMAADFVNSTVQTGRFTIHRIAKCLQIMSIPLDWMRKAING